MSFRFWRRFQLFPGVTVNLSKSGPSVSFGPRGAKLTIGPRGTRATIGLPGTGLFYTTSLTPPKRSGHRPDPAPPPSPTLTPQLEKALLEQRLNLGRFKRWITPDDEEAFIDGCRELTQNRLTEALSHFEKAGHLPDCAFLAGILALKLRQFDRAASWLQWAAKKADSLGRLFTKYGLTLDIQLPITDTLSACIGPNLRGVLLALVESYQQTAQADAAMACLERLLALEPNDPVIRVSLAELLMESQPLTPQQARRVVELTGPPDNATPVHTALLLYKARALRHLGLLEAAREVLNLALRRKQDRPEPLLRALRYERALVYEAMGETKRAQNELERLYAEAPDYADVAARLGLRPPGS